MTEISSIKSDYGPVLNLIDRLARSSDARLRGNARHALVALSELEDPAIADRAKMQLIETLLFEDSSIADDHWRHLLRERTLDAIQQMSQEKRLSVLETAFARLRKMRDKSRHKVIAGALLESEGAGLVVFHSPISVARHLMGAFGVSTLTLIMQAMWRYTVAGLLMMVVLAVIGKMLGSHDTTSLNRAITLGMVFFTLIFGVLARWSFVGRPNLPRWRYYVDAGISGASLTCVSLIDLYLIGWNNTATVSPSSASIGLAITLGFLAGFVTRLGRWPPFPGGKERSLGESILRVAWAVSIATLLAAVPALFGARATAAAIWATLVPACAAIASLDLWLERQHRENAVESRKGVGWALLIGPTALAGMLLLYNFNLLSRNHWAPKPSLAAIATIDLKRVQPGNPQSLEVKYGAIVKLHHGDGSNYWARVTSSNSTDNVMLHHGYNALTDTIDTSTSNEENLGSQSIDGEYWICADAYDTKSCPLAAPKATEDIIDLEIIGRILGGKGFVSSAETTGAKTVSDNSVGDKATNITVTVGRLDQ